MDASDDRYPVVQELMAYWRAHPQASDTVEGICRWWFAAGPSPQPVVQRALAWLQEGGWVQAHRQADGRVRYRLAEARPIP